MIDIDKESVFLRQKKVDSQARDFFLMLGATFCAALSLVLDTDVWAIGLVAYCVFATVLNYVTYRYAQRDLERVLQSKKVLTT